MLKESSSDQGGVRLPALREMDTIERPIDSKIQAWNVNLGQMNIDLGCSLHSGNFASVDYWQAQPCG